MTILFMGSYINNRDIVYKRPPVSPYVSYGSLEAASRHYPQTCKDAVQPATNPYV